jgi:hypothetical protein
MRVGAELDVLYLLHVRFHLALIYTAVISPTRIMRDYWAEYCQHSTTTHPYNENEDTVPLWYDETGYEHFLLVYSLIDRIYR